MKLFLVHCGFYDADLCDAVYESHVNFLVRGESMDDARARAKTLPEFVGRHMHVDGVQEVTAVQGWRVTLAEDPALAGATLLTSSRHRDLAARLAPPNAARSSADL